MDKTSTAKKEKHTNGKDPSFVDLLRQATAAAAIYDWPTAERLYSQGLQMPDLSREMAFELLKGRATCYEYLAEIDQALVDEETLLILAEESGDPRQLVLANNLLARNINVSRTARAIQALDRSLTLARELADYPLLIETHVLAAVVFGLNNDLAASKKQAEAILEIAAALDNDYYEALGYFALGYYQSTGGLSKEASANIKKALPAIRKYGDRSHEYRALNMLGITSPDLGHAQRFYEQAMVVAQTINNKPQQLQILNNLSYSAFMLGLYRRAKEIALQQLAMSSETSHEPTIFQTLAEAYMGTREFTLARTTLAKAMEMESQDAAEGWIDPKYSVMVLGMIAAQEGNYEEAAQLLDGRRRQPQQPGKKDRAGLAKRC